MLLADGRLLQPAPNGFLADPQLCSERSRGRPHAAYCGLRLLFSRPSSGFFAVAEMPAARSFAIRLMSFTGAGLVSGNWTVPFRSLYPLSSSSSLSVAKNVADAANSE